MYYSDDIIEEVRSRNDIVDVIGGYVSLKHKGNSYSACCPFHHEKTPSFHVSRDKQMYHCFGCGAGGNVFTFVMEYENYSFPEAVKLLAERGGVALPEKELTPEQKSRESYKVMLKDMNRTAAAYFHYLLLSTEHGKKALDYLHNRGLTDETIKNFAIGYSDVYSDDLYKYLKKKGYTDKQMKDSGLVEINEGKGAVDKFWNRVMVPILDINGKVIAFGGRVLGDGLPKYVNTKETAVFDKSHNLFAMNIAKRSKRRGIILCEGYMDVISMHQAGFDNAVASLGTAFTIGQANIIKRSTDEVYLAYDSDGAGTKATLKAISILREAGLASRVIDMKPYKDPDEFLQKLGREVYEQRISDAITGIIFEIETIEKGFNLKDPEEYARFANEAAKRLSAIEEPMVRHSYIDTISAKYNFDKDSFKKTVSKYGNLKLKDDVYMEEKPAMERNSEKTIDTAQCMLLTFMVNHPKLFDSLDGMISDEDFSDESCRSVAAVLFRQYKETGAVVPAAIVNMFDEVEEQRVVAKVLQTELPFEPDTEEREKALNDLIKKVKTDTIDRRLAACADDIQAFQGLILEKAGLAKLHISLRNG